MKTKLLVELLQKADPSGELECNVDGHDIYYVDSLSGYYDGSYEVIERDADNEPTKARIASAGTKVRLVTLSIEDLLFDYPEIPVEDETGYAGDDVVRWRTQSIEICNRVEREAFIEYMEPRAAREAMRDLTIEEKRYIKSWTSEHIHHNTPMPDYLNKPRIDPKDQHTWYPSWNDRRKKQWDAELAIILDNVGGFKIVYREKLIWS